MPLRLLLIFVGFLGSGLAFAAGGTPDFYAEVAILIVASAVVGYICFRFGLVPILGFLATGVLLNALGLVDNPALIDAVAEIGVILLLFTIGIEFSLESLLKIRRLILLGGGLQVGLTIALVTGFCLLIGASWQAAIFTGMLISLSSTAIVLKLLASRSEMGTPTGQISLGMLIFQDLAVVMMVILVPILGGEGGSAAGIVWSLVSAVGIIAIILLLARQVMPRVLEALAMTCSQEIFLLGVIAICFGTAFLTGLAGVSLSLGAFLAGLLVSESRFGKQALGEILPLQIIFSAAFFVSVGELLDLTFLFRNLPLVLLIVAGFLTLKSLIAASSARWLGYSLSASVGAGVLLAQVGEFSFVLERAGREVGLFPAGMAETGGQLFIASTVLMMGVTPYLAQLGSKLGRRLEGKGAAAGTQTMPELEESFEDMAGHVIIAGYGRGGKKLARALKAENIDTLILTLSPVGATAAEQEDMTVMRGDYATRFILEQAGIAGAKALVIADDGEEHSSRVLAVVRGIRADLPVLIRMAHESDALALERAGATLAVSEENISLFPLLRDIVDRYQDAPTDFHHIRDLLATTGGDAQNISLKLSTADMTSKKCSHQNQTAEVTPISADACLDCIARGDEWVHLRVCMTCGYVGCCDDSKNQHASKHFHSEGHPIIKSLEEGEDWAWCYEDEAIL